MKQGKGHTFAAMISQSFQSVWMEFDVLLRLGVMNLILVCSLFNIQGREPSMCDFVKKKKKEVWLVFRHLQTYFFQI